MIDAIDIYRDDGPLARALGRTLGRYAPPAPLLLLAAIAPLLAAIALDASEGLAVAVVAWAVVLGGASAGRPWRPKTRWSEPALLRAIEFIGLTWLASLHGESGYPAAFALLAVLSFRHYDLSYRVRQLGTTPAAWVGAMAGGWDGRLIAALALLLLGALPAGYFLAAGALAVAFTAEAVTAWRSAAPTAGPLDDEGEAA
jgi:Family of unknown function (DUF5941)